MGENYLNYDGLVRYHTKLWNEIESANEVIAAALNDLNSNKENEISLSNKLSADLVDDTSTTNKFTNATEKQTWNAKQDALTFNTAPSSSNKVATMADIPTTMTASGSGHNGGLVPDTPSTQGTSKFLREDGTWAEPSNGDTNVIETVKVNGTALTPDANKAVDIKGIITRTDVTGTSVTQALTPNVFYSFGTMTSLTVTLGSVVSGANNLYSFEFSSGTVATTLTLPSTIKWQEDTVTIDPNTHYEVSIKYSPKDEIYYGMISSWYLGLPGNSLQINNITYYSGVPYAGNDGKVLAVGNDYDYSDLSDFKLYDQDGLEVQYYSIGNADSSVLYLRINGMQGVSIDMINGTYTAQASGGSSN